MYFHLTTRIGELGGMVLSNQELCRWTIGVDVVERLLVGR